MARPPRDSSTAIDPILPFGRRPLLTFALTICLPALAMYGTLAVLIFTTLGSTSDEVNLLERERGTAAVHAALNSFLNDLSVLNANQGTSDEAYLNVVKTPDPAWMDQAWGTNARQRKGYDTVFVTDHLGRIEFGENSAGALVGNIAEHIPGAAATLAELNAGIEVTGDGTEIAHFASDEGGVLALSGVSIHRTSGSGITIPRRDRRILWSVQHLTGDHLQSMSARYQTPLTSLVTDVPAGWSAIDIPNPDGTIAGTVTWQADRPGQTAMSHALPFATLVLALVCAALAGALVLLYWAIDRRARAVISHQVAMARRVDASVAAPQPVAATAAPEAVAAGVSPEPVDTVTEGIAAAKFDIKYQPIFDLANQTLVGVEGLLRWTTPDQIPLLEETLTPAQRATLLDRIGILALRRAADELAALPDLKLTMTVTPAQLSNALFCEKLAATLGATGFSGSRMVLSIDAPLLPPVAVIEAPVTDLRRLGIGIALGHFVLNPLTRDYLNPAVASEVRIAASADVGMTQSGLEEGIAAAKTAGLEIAAFGVEDKAEMARLLRRGCRRAQGNLFAHPMSIAALTQLVTAPSEPEQIRQAG